MPVIYVSDRQLNRMVELCGSDREIHKILLKESIVHGSNAKLLEIKQPEWGKRYIHGRRRNTKEGVSVRVDRCPCNTRYHSKATDEQKESVKKVGSEYVCNQGEYSCPYFKGVKDVYSHYGFDVMCELA